MRVFTLLSIAAFCIVGFLLIVLGALIFGGEWAIVGAVFMAIAAILQVSCILADIHVTLGALQEIAVETERLKLVTGTRRQSAYSEPPPPAP